MPASFAEPVDPRATQLQAWALDYLQREQPALIATGDLTVVSGDASFRRYFRLPLAQGSLIAVDAPPDKENSRPFVAIARALRAHGVAVPEVLAADFDHGFMLLEDFGDTVLRPQLTEHSAGALYTQSLKTLQHLLSCPAPADYPLPLYDKKRLHDEMNLLSDWFLPRYLNLTLSTAQQNIVEQAFALIANAVLQQPQVFVHRDYHSRNLMCVENNARGSIGVIDFQDAVQGPITYDAVSLLRDAYVVWPPASVQRWVQEFAAMLRAAHQLNADDATFQQWFDWMGAQRHLKVLGIFARLSIRDGKHGYLQDMPLVFHYLLEEIKPYAPLRDFFELLQGIILPAYLLKNPSATALLAPWLAAENAGTEASGAARA